jgi:small subunit ribosomal protein S18
MRAVQASRRFGLSRGLAAPMTSASGGVYDAELGSAPAAVSEPSTVVVSDIDAAAYEREVDALTMWHTSVESSAERSDAFLKRRDPAAYYMRKVNEHWAADRCYFNREPVSDMHVTNAPFLNLFVSEAGNIRPRYSTKISAKYQRKLAKNIKRARQMNLMPFVGSWSSRRHLRNFEIAAEEAPARKVADASKGRPQKGGGGGGRKRKAR